MVAIRTPTLLFLALALEYSTIEEKLSQYSVGSPPPKKRITSVPAPDLMRFRTAFLVPRSIAAFAISQGIAPYFLGAAPEKQYLHPKLQSFVGKKQIVESSTSPLGKGFASTFGSSG